MALRWRFFAQTSTVIVTLAEAGVHAAQRVGAGWAAQAGGFLPSQE
ncbi:hypothetical protein C725_2264 [Pacificimonas flava]|uniref:Uncharacterized protein n=1 Tax=Pacificimonas flava TaxID=1234595 RepID=M2TKN4_9SPHN|nr:hypothetical protein C725_2264 [Pacificimonas flava]